MGYMVRKVVLFLVVGSIAVALFRGASTDPNGAIHWLQTTSSNAAHWVQGLAGGINDTVDKTPKPGNIIPSSSPSSLPKTAPSAHK